MLPSQHRGKGEKKRHHPAQAPSPKPLLKLETNGTWQHREGGGAADGACVHHVESVIAVSIFKFKENKVQKMTTAMLAWPSPLPSACVIPNAAEQEPSLMNQMALPGCGGGGDLLWSLVGLCKCRGCRSGRYHVPLSISKPPASLVIKCPTKALSKRSVDRGYKEGGRRRHHSPSATSTIRSRRVYVGTEDAAAKNSAMLPADESARSF